MISFSKNNKHMLTAIIVLVAVVVVYLKYAQDHKNPWTRDGQVRAQVVQIAARVSGPIVKLPIVDNQFVKTGEVLFEIDPRTYQASVDQARAQLEETDDNYGAQGEQVEAAKAAVQAAAHAVTQARTSIKQADAQIQNNSAELGRQKDLLPKRATTPKSVNRAQANYDVSVSQRAGAVAAVAQAQASFRKAQANLAQARASQGATGDANARIRAARATLTQAELNLEFTKVRAPVDGYVTNLNLRLGSQVVANQPVLALVDVSSYWIVGFFRENYVANIHSGRRAIVTLMTYPDTPLEGRVQSLGWGIAQNDGSTGFELLPNVSPTFEWIRLAQRIPVRIRLDSVPEEVKLRVGTTCSVHIKTDH